MILKCWVMKILHLQAKLVLLTLYQELTSNKNIVRTRPFHVLNSIQQKNT